MPGLTTTSRTRLWQSTKYTNLAQEQNDTKALSLMPLQMPTMLANILISHYSFHRGMATKNRVEKIYFGLNYVELYDYTTIYA
jgi:hypothetical protein